MTARTPMATYPVTCDCGATHHVDATAAGSKLACCCGCSVEVPSLVRLKANAGEASISADFEIEHLLATNSLPVEPNCYNCDIATTHCRHVLTECERVIVQAESSSAAGMNFLH